MLTMLEFNNGKVRAYRTANNYVLEFETHTTQTYTFASAHELEHRLHSNGVRPCDAELVHRLTVRRP